MEITIHGDVGNVIEHAEAGSTVVGVDKRSIVLNWSNEEQINQLLQELHELKKKLSDGKENEYDCTQIDVAVSAIQEKNEPKLRRALKCLGRESINLVEGIAGSVLATLIMQM